LKQQESRTRARRWRLQTLNVVSMHAYAFSAGMMMAHRALILRELASLPSCAFAGLQTEKRFRFRTPSTRR